jgi:adenine nucleotide transporter 17
VYREYGLPGFWNGTAASLIMVVNPTLQYALYEWLLAARAKLRCGAAPSCAARH